MNVVADFTGLSLLGCIVAAGLIVYGVYLPGRER